MNERKERERERLSTGIPCDTHKPTLFLNARHSIAMTGNEFDFATDYIASILSTKYAWNVDNVDSLWNGNHEHRNKYASHRQSQITMLNVTIFVEYVKCLKIAHL